jgi:hypothetical protein
MKRTYPSGHSKRTKAAEDQEKLEKLPKLTRFLISTAPSTSRSRSEQNVSIEENIATDSSTLEKSLQHEVLETEVNTELLESENIPTAFSTDPALWHPINNELRSYWINKGPSTCQNHTCGLSKSARDYTEGGKTKTRYLSQTAFKRVLRNGETVTREWLLYSPSKGSIYCFVCRLFSHKCTTFGSAGFNDWKHVSDYISGHENSVEHRNCMIIYINRKNQTSQIDSALIIQVKIEQQYWCEVLKRIVAVVKFLATRGLALRGSNQNIGSLQNGNYLGTLELISQFDPFISEHIKKYGNAGKGIPSYLSANICEEFIALMGAKVLSVIVSELKKAKYYSISVDSTPDICHVDQLSFTVRYVKNHIPIERFLQFIPIHGHGAD